MWKGPKLNYSSESLKHPKDEKAEKSKRWSRRSKQSRDQEPPAEKAEATGAVGTAAEKPSAEKPSAEKPSAEKPSAEKPSAEDTSENLPEMYRSQTAEGENGVVVTGAAAEPATPAKTPPSKPESRLRNWFKGRRRASPRPKEPAQKEANRTTSSADAAVRRDSRGAALGSHPITGDELVDMQRRRSSLASAPEEGAQSGAKETGEGKRPSRLRSSFIKMASRNNRESKTNGHAGGAAGGESQAAEPSEAQGTSTADREGLRDSAAEQGLPVPPAIGKQTSNGTGAGTRESRFSEDL